jgi:hypothetical protein
MHLPRCMQARLLAALGILLITGAGCGSSKECPPAPPPEPKPPVRGAGGDSDLRVFMSELTAAKACELMRGQYRPLRAPDRPDVATGTLWIRECSITAHGDKVSFHLAGNGWQWANQTKKKAGAKFELAQYVRFAVDLPMPGAVDVAYDRSSHVVSLWFSPDHVPEVAFTPVGSFDVDRKGWWSTVLGGLSSLFGSSPEDQARTAAKGQGTHEFEKSLADGLALTIAACTGLSRFNLGRPDKGDMQRPDVGETYGVPIEVHPSGLSINGPYLAPHGMTATLEVSAGGKVRAALMCADDSEQLAAAYLAEQELPEVETLAIADITGKGTLKAKRTRCPVALVIREIPLAGEAPVTVRWKRPAGESARSTGGPLIECGKRKQTAQR